MMKWLNTALRLGITFYLTRDEVFATLLMSPLLAARSFLDYMDTNFPRKTGLK